MLSLEEYSEGRSQPFHNILETLLGLPCEPRQGVPRTPVQDCCPGARGEGAGETQRWSLLFSQKIIPSRTRTGDI